MKRFLRCSGLVGIVLCHTTLHVVEAASAKAGKTPSRSTPHAPAVTRGNFVSIELQISGGIANLQEKLTINGNQISKISVLLSPPEGGAGEGTSAPKGFRGGNSAAVSNSGITKTSALSNNQLDALIRLLNEVKFTSLVGRYSEPHLRDGLHETVTLRISDEKNIDRLFVVANYGNRAPAGFSKVRESLRQLKQQKFAVKTQRVAMPKITVPRVSRDNLVSLEWASSSGDANARTTFTYHSGLGHPLQPAILFVRPRISGSVKGLQKDLLPYDLDQLCSVLNNTAFTRLLGTHARPYQADGTNETISFTLRDVDGRHKVFAAGAYGKNAPSAFSSVMKQLRELTTKIISRTDSDKSKDDAMP